MKEGGEVPVEIDGGVIDGVGEHGGGSVGATDVSCGAHELDACSGASEGDEAVGSGEIASVVVQYDDRRVGESDALT